MNLTTLLTSVIIVDTGVFHYLKGLPISGKDVILDLVLITNGMSNTEIGGRHFDGLATATAHVNRIFAKTGVRGRVQLDCYAY